MVFGHWQNSIRRSAIEIQKLFSIIVLFGLILIGVKGKVFSLLLAWGLGEYFKNLAVTDSPEPTTTIKSEQNEQKTGNKV